MSTGPIDIGRPTCHLIAIMACQTIYLILTKRHLILSKIHPLILTDIGIIANRCLCWITPFTTSLFLIRRIWFTDSPRSHCRSVPTRSGWSFVMNNGRLRRREFGLSMVTVVTPLSQVPKTVANLALYPGPKASSTATRRQATTTD
ncbi:hypothetical protein V6Z11_A03G178200 [Gossypium hirsutum]